MINKKTGFPILFMGLVLLTAGILVLVYVPQWGDWIGSYPQTVLQKQLPAEAQALVKGMMQFSLGPLIQQIGGYLRIGGYFIGSLITLISLGITIVSLRIISKGYLFSPVSASKI
jgi:hypothetical protein